jgi:hypothetical protein
VCLVLRQSGGGGSARASAPVILAPAPGPLYMIRVVGDKFSFYSTELSARFLQFVGDYSSEDDLELLPETMVYKYSVAIPSPATAASASGAALAPSAPASTVQDQWQFQAPDDRKHIIHMLDQIQQILRR